MKSLALLGLLVSGTAAAENGRPYFADEDPVSIRKASVETPFQETFRAVDPDGDRIEVTAEGLPAGATLRVRDPRPWTDDEGPGAKETRARYSEVVLTWTPARGQRGDHPVALLVSDGTASERIQITVKVEEEWESWFLPGLQYVGYFPVASDRFGSFHGAGFELVIASWVHQTDVRGPSHGRVYLDLALLDSDRAEVERAYGYALGLDLSLERNPRRRWLIPIFGIEVGGFHQAQTGSFFQATPLAGAHLFSSRNVFVTATVGYVFSGRDIDELGGWRVRAGANVVLW